MYYFLVTTLVLDALLLGVVILLQAGQGGGLASLGGGTTDLVVGGRQAATLLTKMSWICGGGFMFLALLISLISPTRSGSDDAVLEQIRRGTEAPATAPLPFETAPAATTPADSTAN
jgi:preprotein translocase subunit SecG